MFIVIQLPNSPFVVLLCALCILSGLSSPAENPRACYVEKSGEDLNHRWKWSLTEQNPCDCDRWYTADDLDITPLLENMMRLFNCPVTDRPTITNEKVFPTVLTSNKMTPSSSLPPSSGTPTIQTSLPATSYLPTSASTSVPTTSGATQTPSVATLSSPVMSTPTKANTESYHGKHELTENSSSSSGTDSSVGNLDTSVYGASISPGEKPTTKSPIANDAETPSSSQSEASGATSTTTGIEVNTSEHAGTTTSGSTAEGSTNSATSMSSEASGATSAVAGTSINIAPTSGISTSSSPTPQASWSDWSSWGNCTFDGICPGREERTRQCLDPWSTLVFCPGNANSSQFCNDDKCPSWSEWSSWGNCTYNGTCPGRQERTRQCQDPWSTLASCLGNANDSQFCNDDKCQGGGGGTCFSSNSLIRVKIPSHGEMQTVIKTLKELKVGELVESYDPKSELVTFSVVYFITHQGSFANTSRLLKLVYNFNYGQQLSIRLHAKHLVYACVNNASVNLNGNTCNHPPSYPVTAESVKVGDILWVKNTSDQFFPTSVIEVCETHDSVRHPMTMNHYIVVDDVLASVHMYDERLYRKITAPLLSVQCTSKNNRFIGGKETGHIVGSG